MRKKLFLIDGSAIFYKSYFAFIRNPLINSKGENTSATFGFLSTLFKLLEIENPDYLAVIFDTKEPTFRHKIYDQYKATREKMPDEMAATYPRMIDTLKSMKINLMDKDGYEADDIIATIVNKFSSMELDIFIMSTDKDLAQLVDDNVKMYSFGTGNVQADIMDRLGVKNKYGVNPEEIVDWLALMGDTSDNVPGVPGIGPKRAVELIETYGSLEELYRQIDSLKTSKLKDNLVEFEQQAYLSKRLVILDKNVPQKFGLEDLAIKNWDQKNLAMILKDMEFNRLITRAETIHKKLFGEGDAGTDTFTETKTEYKLVETQQQLDELINELSNQQEFCFDTETDSLDVFSAHLAGIAFSFKSRQAWYIPVNHPGSPFNEKDVLEKIKPVFENEQIAKIGQNLKYDVMIMRQHGILVKNIHFDTMLASYLLNPSSNQHKLDTLAEEHLKYQMIPIEEIIGSGKNQTTMTQLSAEKVYNYACEDADITLQLKNIFEPKLKEFKLNTLFFQVEMPLAVVLMDMEEHGVSIDTDLLKIQSNQLAEKIQSLQQQIYEQAGEEFNINSPQQLGTILFEKLKIHEQLNSRRPPKTKTGQFSTSEQILERFSAHPLPSKILEFRQLTKLKNTYLDALPALIHPKTGKIHTSYNQSVAATGRLSSSNPNLQNIPIRTEAGREIRKAFVCSKPDQLIISADYSQIELRILAHLSGDPRMKDSFEQNLDIHASTAAQIFDLPISDVNSDLRRKAKAINFGIIYGMSKYGLANRLSISADEAEQFMFEYFATYPKIQDYMRSTIEQANEFGFVTTMLNRRRYIPQIRSTNRQFREFAERTAINTTIQGSAADMIKLAMIKIHRALESEKLKSKMILQVHDELVFEVSIPEKDRVKNLIKSEMENALELDVPVLVEIGEGNNWLDAH